MLLYKIDADSEGVFLRRRCQVCKKSLKHSDERYEVNHITFNEVRGLSRNICGKFCPECYKKVMKENDK